MKYDLEERVTKLAINIISFCKEIPKNNINFPLIDQLIRSWKVRLIEENNLIWRDLYQDIL